MQLAERFKQGGREVKKAPTLRSTGCPCRPAAGARIFILRLTFKENCLDLRNTCVTDLIAELQDYGMQVDVHDPWADPEEAWQEYGLELTQKPQLGSYDAIVLAVAHRQYREMGAGAIRTWLKSGGVVYDVKHVLPPASVDGRL